jgi:hypothetical protein
MVTAGTPLAPELTVGQVGDGGLLVTVGLELDELTHGARLRYGCGKETLP